LLLWGIYPAQVDHQDDSMMKEKEKILNALKSGNGILLMRKQKLQKALDDAGPFAKRHSPTDLGRN
jgi:hypothetical protein